MEYLGNKSGVIEMVTDQIEAHADGPRVADLFSGTGTVSAALADRGFSVHANDLLPLAVEWGVAHLRITEEPTFSGIAHLIDIDPSRGAYSQVVDHLRSLPPSRGWITRSFTPASADTSPYLRKYFTVENGEKIDSVRSTIRSWAPHLSRSENALLRCSLVSAADKVGNTAGTYGSYLREFKRKSLDDFTYQPIPYEMRREGNTVTKGDAETVARTADFDVVYADPPYTKRQYAAYYHVLNAIVGDAEPTVQGKTGLSDWRQWNSHWCHARRAPAALHSLLSASRSRAFVLSYSSDGHIPHETVLDILGSFGRTTFVETRRRRYRSSGLNQQSTSVAERVYAVSR